VHHCLPYVARNCKLFYHVLVLGAPIPIPLSISLFHQNKDPVAKKRNIINKLINLSMSYMETTLRGYNSPRKLLRIAACHHNGGCAVNGTAVAAVLLDQSRSFMNLHIRYVHWIAARLPNSELFFWGGRLSPTLGNTCHTHY